MNLNSQQINIMLMVPFQDNPKPIPLTLDTIYHPDLKDKTGMSNIPYITSSVKYPSELINKISISGYQDVVSFFFNKSQFEKLLRPYVRESSPYSSREILEYNAMTMLKNLFPCIENVSNSYNEYILLQTGQNFTVNVALASIFSAISSNNQTSMSYIMINGKKYTITKTVLLNDLLNNPVYKRVIDEYIKYVSWSDEESKKINEELKNSITNLIYKFDKDKEGKKGDLNISIYADRFQKIYVPEEVSSKPSSSRTENIITFNSYIDEMQRSIAQIYKMHGVDALKAMSDINIFISSFNESLLGIKQLYKLIVDSKLMIKTPSELSNKIDALIKESTYLKNLSYINKEYIATKNINMKLEKNSDITDILRTKYKTYIELTELMRSIIAPLRESTNISLQKSINDYSQNQNTGVRFNHIMEKVSEKYMFKSIPNKGYVDIDLTDYMNIGINRINMNDQKMPQYEIYISMNLIENEYDIKDLTCIYEGFFLGKKLEDIDKVNPHISNLHSIFLSQSDIDKEKNKNLSSSSSNPNLNNAVVGGRKTRKYKRRRKMQNTLKWRGNKRNKRIR